MTARYRTKDGDALDRLCWKHYGRSLGALEAVLAANPSLAQRSPVFPVGIEILVPEQAGEGDPVYSIRHTYRDADQARRAAAAKLDAFERGSATLDLALPGRPEAGAECPLLLVGFRPGVDGRWIVTRAERRIEDGGYSCSLSAEVPKTTQNQTEEP